MNEAVDIRPRPFSAWELGLAFRYLRARRKAGGVALIAAISFVGVLLAVAVLIIVMSVMNGFRTELLAKTLSFNGHMAVQGAPLESPGREAMLARVRAVDGVTFAAPLVENPVGVVAGGQGTGAVVRGIRRQDLSAIRIVTNGIRSGSVAGFGIGDYGGDQVLVGQALATQLGVGPGDPIRLISFAGGTSVVGATPLEKTYVVGAVFSVGLSNYDAAYIYMPLEQAQLFVGREGAWDVIEIGLADADRAVALAPVVRQAAGRGAVVTEWTTRDKAFFEALQVERTVMRLILMLIVAIAAMNIISGIVMLVKNKGRDIAILRTMGASRNAILRVFFVAGASIGAAGTLGGLLVGVLFCVFIGPIQNLVERFTGFSVFNSDIYFLSHLPARVEPLEVVFIVFWSLFMACLATLPPALQASKIDPVEALRYE